MMDQAGNNKFVTFVVLLIAVAGGGGYYYWHSMENVRSEIKTLESQLSSLQIKLKENIAVADNLPLFAKQLKDECGVNERGPFPSIPELSADLMAPPPPMTETLQLSILNQQRDDLVKKVNALNSQFSLFVPPIREVERLRQLHRSCKKK